MVQVGEPRHAPTLDLEQVAAQFAAEAEYWDRTYAESDVRSLIYQRRQEIALEWVDALGLPPGARALDTGTGAGHAAIALARRSLTVDAMDATASMLPLVRKNAIAADVADRVATHIGQAEALGFGPAVFDLVVGLGVLPWVPDPAAAVVEMARVLKPGGHLIVSTANKWRLTYRLDPLHSQDLMPIKRPIRRWLENAGHWPGTCPESLLHSAQDTDALIARAGLSKLASCTFGFGPFTLLGRRLLPAKVGARLHLLLQRMADRGSCGLAEAGTEYLLLARKPG
jgi:ubiquinone/menaquinone biosynthesis C-methylase UbiE